MQLKTKVINLPPVFAKCSSVSRDAVIFLHPECMQQNNVNAGDCVFVSNSRKTRVLFAFAADLSQTTLSNKQCAVAISSTFAKCNELSVNPVFAISSAETVVFRTEPKLHTDKLSLFGTIAKTTLRGLPVMVGQEFEFAMADQRILLTAEALILVATDANPDLPATMDVVTNGLNSLSVHDKNPVLNGHEFQQNNGVNHLSSKDQPVVCRIDSETNFSVSNAKPADACSPTPTSTSSLRQLSSFKASSTPSAARCTNIVHTANGAVQQHFAGYSQQQSFLLELLQHAYLSAAHANKTTAEISQPKVTPRAKSKRVSLPRTPSTSSTNPTPENLPFTACMHAKSLLVYGVAGVGKSLFVQHVVNAFQASIQSVSSAAVAVIDIPPLSFLSATGTANLAKKNYATGDLDAVDENSVESRIEQFSAAESRNTFHIVVIDELDLMPIQTRAGSVNAENGTSADRKAYAALCNLLDFVHRSANNVFLIATIRLADSLPISLRRAGRFDIELEIPPPSTADRVALLRVLLNNIMHVDVGEADEQPISTEKLDELCRTLHGYVYCDLQSLVMHATRLAALPSSSSTGETWKPVCPRIEHLYAAMRCVRPSAMREIIIDVTHTRWADIGGYANVKKCIRQSVEWAVHDQPERFRLYGITPPRGVLLFGPPGCSKTLMAKAIACEAGLNFLVIKGPELFNKYVGESERAVREVFRRARFAAPACIFIDEIDALGGERSGGGGGGSSSRASSGGQSVSDRMLATLLNELDGVEELKQVVVIAATNRPDVIDKALLRPGRLDRIIYVPLPDVDSRREILSGRLARMPVEELFSVDELVKRTEGYSGAELVAVCQEAGMIALEKFQDLRPDEALQNLRPVPAEEMPKVSEAQFLSALKRVKPRTKSSAVKFYEEWAQEMAFGHE